jgi:FkbM family methyltransferase
MYSLHIGIGACQWPYGRYLLLGMPAESNSCLAVCDVLPFAALTRSSTMLNRQIILVKCKNKVKSLLVKAKNKLFASRFQRVAESEIDYQVGKFSIKLPLGHKLPEYAKSFPQYDRFLPHLASHMSVNSMVIDVGANCADTLAAMANRNPTLQFLCVEGDKEFFEYLIENIKRIHAILPTLSVRAVNSLAAKDINGVILSGGNGTKSAAKPEVASSNSSILVSKTLDNIVIDSGIALDKISLIKIDTDGFDYDVINSAEQIIAESSPLLFFECQFNDEAQKMNLNLQSVYLSSVGIYVGRFSRSLEH